MQRPPRPDPLPLLMRAAAADTVATRLAALDHAVERWVGHKLFTVLVLNWEKGENQRYYRNLPDAYPVGGAKPINLSTSSTIMEGQCRYLDTYEDVKAAFFDHELIRSLGCESCVNVPIRWNGTTIGAMNILHEANWYGSDDAPTLKMFAALAAPAAMEIIAGWGKP